MKKENGIVAVNDASRRRNCLLESRGECGRRSTKAGI
jgi:hypothetical protein